MPAELACTPALAHTLPAASVLDTSSISWGLGRNKHATASNLYHLDLDRSLRSAGQPTDSGRDRSAAPDLKGDRSVVVHRADRVGLAGNRPLLLTEQRPRATPFESHNHHHNHHPQIDEPPTPYQASFEPADGASDSGDNSRLRTSTTTLHRVSPPTRLTHTPTPPTPPQPPPTQTVSRANSVSSAPGTPYQKKGEPGYLAEHWHVLTSALEKAARNRDALASRAASAGPAAPSAWSPACSNDCVKSNGLVLDRRRAKSGPTTPLRCRIHPSNAINRWRARRRRSDSLFVGYLVADRGLNRHQSNRGDSRAPACDPTPSLHARGD